MNAPVSFRYKTLFISAYVLVRVQAHIHFLSSGNYWCRLGKFEFKPVIAFQLSIKCIKIYGSFCTFAKTEIWVRKEWPGKMPAFQGITYWTSTCNIDKTPEQGFNYKQIAKRLNITDAPEGRWYQISSGSFQTRQCTEIFHGKYKIKITRGISPVLLTWPGWDTDSSKPDDLEDDVFVTAKKPETALHGDKVKVWALC